MRRTRGSRSLLPRIVVTMYTRTYTWTLRTEELIRDVDLPPTIMGYMGRENRSTRSRQILGFTRHHCLFFLQGYPRDVRQRRMQRCTQENIYIWKNRSYEKSNAAQQNDMRVSVRVSDILVKGRNPMLPTDGTWSYDNKTEPSKIEAQPALNGPIHMYAIYITVYK